MCLAQDVLAPFVLLNKPEQGEFYEKPEIR
jgi:hypothetical protein